MGKPGARAKRHLRNRASGTGLRHELKVVCGEGLQSRDLGRCPAIYRPRPDISLSSFSSHSQQVRTHARVRRPTEFAVRIDLGPVIDGQDDRGGSRRALCNHYLRRGTGTRGQEEDQAKNGVSRCMATVATTLIVSIITEPSTANVRRRRAHGSLRKPTMHKILQGKSF